VGAMKRSFAVGPGQLVIDLGTEPDRDLIPELIEYLNSGPSLDGILQMLVLEFLRNFGARSAEIRLLGQDASLRSVAAFGAPEVTANFQDNICLWDDSPMTHAIRRKTTVVVPSAAIHLAQFPDSETCHLPIQPTISARLASLAGTVGVLSVNFGEELTSNPPAARVVESIADVLVLYLTGRGVVQSDEPRSDVVTQRKSAVTPAREVPDGLTPRQSEILALLCQKMTYDQIAMRIKFSHSTVRQELGLIYRVLDVSSRRDAIRVAHLRGLVQPTLADPRVYDPAASAS